MHLLLMTNQERVIEGVLLAVGKGMLRVAVKGCADTVQLDSLGEDRWASNQGQVYEIASITAGSAETMRGLDGVLQTPPLVMTAGGAMFF